MEENSYSTFHVKSRDGRDIEMAVVEEFQYDNKHYIVGDRLRGSMGKDFYS